MGRLFPTAALTGEGDVDTSYREPTVTVTDGADAYPPCSLLLDVAVAAGF